MDRKQQLYIELFTQRKELIKKTVYFILDLVYGTVSIILMFFLSDGKNSIAHLSDLDTVLFVFLFVSGILSLTVFAFILGKRHIRCYNKFQKDHRALYQYVLRTMPTRPGNVLLFLLNDHVFPTVRVTVYGYPDTDDMYFIVETVNKKYEIEIIYESKIYACFDELNMELEGFVVAEVPKLKTISTEETGVQ